MGRAPYLADAERSKADLVCRISEFRKVFGAEYYAELMLRQAEAVGRVIDWEREERRLKEMLREQHEAPEPEREWLRQ
jgi:threonyl-tRNA synthetase